jgi:hypothetical protein
MVKTALYIAIYGAGLSTVLALVKLIPEWPIITLVPPAIPDADVSLQIINPAKRPLFIEGSTQFPRHKPRLRIIEQRSLDRREEIARAFEEREWHRNWLFRHAPLPTCVRVSSNLVSLINRT